MLVGHSKHIKNAIGTGSRSIHSDSHSNRNLCEDVKDPVLRNPCKRVLDRHARFWSRLLLLSGPKMATSRDSRDKIRGFGLRVRVLSKDDVEIILRDSH